jgi:iron complex transport system substrate-binding protein
MRPPWHIPRHLPGLVPRRVPRRVPRLVPWRVPRLAAGLLLGFALGCASGTPQAAGRPERIVSLDLCTDQLLIELAQRTRIAAVTHLAADPAVSAIPALAKGIPVTHGAAEDVLGYDPDLVLAGPHGVSPTVGLLRRLQRNVVIVPLAADLDGVRASVRAVAAAIGETAKGEAMIAAFDRQLAGLPAAAATAPAPTALIYQVGGSVSGAGSLADAVLTAAGFRNLAAEYRLTRAGQVPLESLAARPPDLLVLSSAADEYRTAAADNLRHPALLRLRRRHASLELPWQLWLCGTPRIAEAVARLAKARAAIEAGRR